MSLPYTSANRPTDCLKKIIETINFATQNNLFIKCFIHSVARKDPLNHTHGVLIF